MLVLQTACENAIKETENLKKKKRIQQMSLRANLTQQARYLVK